MIYPFVPKTTTRLVAGHFWAVPLSDGRYACGRVLQARGPRLSRVTFYGGLLDWVASTVPTRDSIAGSQLARAGVMHLKAVWTTGETILGERALELDGIELPLARSSGGWKSVEILRGTHPVRPAEACDESKYPVLSTWGYDVVRVVAERRFVSGAGDEAPETHSSSAIPVGPPTQHTGEG